MTQLFDRFIKEERKKLQTKLKIANVMAVPKLVKIAINIGLGEAQENKKVIEVMSGQLADICGQKPQITHARHDISAFKLRKGEPIGLKVTLRGNRMYDFYDKLVKIVFPRLRDFRGIPQKGFDGKGSFTLGLSEQIVFPEIEYSKIDKIRGLEITFVTSAKNAKDSKDLLEILGMPFSKS